LYKNPLTTEQMIVKNNENKIAFFLLSVNKNKYMTIANIEMTVVNLIKNATAQKILNKTIILIWDLLAFGIKQTTTQRMNRTNTSLAHKWWRNNNELKENSRPAQIPALTLAVLVPIMTISHDVKYTISDENSSGVYKLVPKTRYNIARIYSSKGYWGCPN